MPLKQIAFSGGFSNKRSFPYTPPTTSLTGSGTLNYIPLWTGTEILSNSILQQPTTNSLLTTTATGLSAIIKNLTNASLPQTILQTTFQATDSDGSHNISYLRQSFIASNPDAEMGSGKYLLEVADYSGLKPVISSQSYGDAPQLCLLGDRESVGINTLDVVSDLVLLGTSQGQMYIKGNYLNVGYTSQSDGVPLIINNTGFDNDVNYSRDLIVQDGKGAGIILVGGTLHSVGIGKTSSVPACLLALQSDTSFPYTNTLITAVGNFTAASGTLSRSLFCSTRKDFGTLTDDGVLVLAEKGVDYRCGTGYVFLSQGFSAGIISANFTFSTQDGVSIFNAIGAVSTADTDGNLCIFNDPISGNLVVKNRLGAKSNIGYAIDFFSNPTVV